MDFHVIQVGQRPPSTGSSCAYLRIDHWNDYSFQTLFQLYCFDEHGSLHELGDVKVGFKGQTIATPTYRRLASTFSQLDASFFSLGQSIDFYKQLSTFSRELRHSIVDGLRDLAAQPEVLQAIEDEPSLSTSLLRNVSLATVKGQFARVLSGHAARTNFDFRFVRPETELIGAIDVQFNVIAESTPSTNVHAVIGRNGVGKTTLLNSMIEAVTRPDSLSRFLTQSYFGIAAISPDYFSSLVSVSFSAFDPFTPPRDQPDPAKGTCYFYVGLKDPENPDRLRSLKELHAECATALIACFSRNDRTDRWHRVISELGSDENFASMRLERLHEDYIALRTAWRSSDVQVDSENFRDRYLYECHKFLERMSSGHAVVFLIMTRLVSLVEEKTLILLDEPESHLHPPLLAAFVRALTDLLHDRNGIALIATHSPVVLQEIPRSCVWKIYRTAKAVDVERPRVETFGENVGTLTSEVFRLEVSRSGFHKLLAQSVADGLTYDDIVSSYGGQLGLEGRAVLKLLIATDGAATS
jgi:predicted ATPase